LKSFIDAVLAARVEDTLGLFGSLKYISDLRGRSSTEKRYASKSTPACASYADAF
jgi:hypothetical protein